MVQNVPYDVDLMHELLKSSSSTREDVLKSLFQSGCFSDCKIKCKDREWKVHKFVICPQSSFFRGALQGQFKEAHEGCVDLSLEDELAVDALLKYLYGYYRDEDVLSDTLGRVGLAALYELASRLGVDDCAQVAGIVFQEDLNMASDNPDYLADQAKMVDYVYKTPRDDKTLREALIELCVGFNEERLEHERDFFEKAIAENAEFALDLLKAHAAARDETE